MSMPASHKRCHYEVLGLPRDCTPEQIRSAYRKLALQRHPDKLVQSGLSQEEATAQFQELVKAYEVLSDLKERQWYDSHRSQILFTDPNISSKVNSSIPDLSSFCSNSVYSGFTDTRKGFYKVYSDLFNKIYVNELQYARIMGLRADLVKEVPLMGNLDSPYEQVAAFYNYWLAFSTIMDFGWVDEYDATAGPDRRTRRLMEEDNNKLRKRAKREYNDTVKRLAEFVKKRDKRVIDMKAKREKEMEIKKEKEIERRKMLQKEKMERASRYEEPEWAKIQEEEEEEEEEEEPVGDDENKKHELYCVACSKRFKSDKQWKNHEQSKKHKEKVADLREFCSEEEGIEKGDQFENANNDVDELKQQFSEEFKLQEDDNESGDDGISNTNEEHEGEREGEEEEEEEDDSVDVADWVKVTAKDYDDTKNEDDVDGETYILEAMARRKASAKNADKYEDREESENISNKLNVDDKTDDDGFMEYDNRKKTGRNQGRRKNKGKKSGGESNTMPNPPETAAFDEETNGNGNSHVNESPSHSFETSERKDRLDDNVVDKKRSKAAQVTDRKAKVSKKGTVPKQENITKGNKHQAAGSKNSGNVCGNCGEEFLSRNQLHKHLGETGHASLKSR